MKETVINIATRDRPTELALLLWSLRAQTYQDFDIFILEDSSGTSLFNYHFLNCIMNKLKEEGHNIEVERTPFNYGVSKSRQTLAEKSLKAGYQFICRLDDDVILNEDYLEKLRLGIEKGYDLMSGTTPFIGQPQFKRESRFMAPVGNKVILDGEGNFIYNGDSCGMEYYYEAVIPLDHFRSCALYKTKIHEKVSYDSRLTKHGFREEQIFSFKMIIEGFKLGCNTKAVAWHLLTPSGGERFSDSQELIKINQQVLEAWTKEAYQKHGDFIKSYHDRLGIKVNLPSAEELLSPENLAHVK